MNFSRKNKSKKTNPKKVYGLPKLEALSQEQREQLYEKNFQELDALRRNVYSSLNIWPGNTYLPARQKASAPERSPQHKPQQQNQTNSVTDQQQYQKDHQPQQKKQQRDMEKQQLEQNQAQSLQKKQKQHQDSERQMQQFQEGSKVLQDECHIRSGDSAIRNACAKDLSENKNYLNTPLVTNKSSLGAVAQESVPPKPERFVEVDESSDFDFSSLMDLDLDLSDF